MSGSSRRAWALRVRAGLWCLTAWLATADAQAQPLTLTVPYAPGGHSDVVARAMAMPIGSAWGASVFVNNQVGANGLVGLRQFAGRPPDEAGLLLFNLTSFLAAAASEPQLLDGVRPLTLLGISPMALVSRAGSGRLEEAVLAPARTTGVLRIATSGVGSASHLCAEQLAAAIGVRLQAQHYKGAAPALADLLAGQADLACMESPILLAQLLAGRLAALAVSDDEGQALMPGVPTLEQAGLQGITRGQWMVALVREGVEPVKAERMSRAVRAALGTESVVNLMRKVGILTIPPHAATPEAATSFIQREFGRLKPLLVVMKGP
jgi:tripartite-type tricarboxylate transporter receptor subunit TctC